MIQWSFHRLSRFFHRSLNNFPLFSFSSNLQWGNNACSWSRFSCRAVFHGGSEVQISKTVLIQGNVAREMTAHSGCTTVCFHMCIAHGVMLHDLCVIYVANECGLYGVWSDCDYCTLMSTIWVFCAENMCTFCVQFKLLMFVDFSFRRAINY